MRDAIIIMQKQRPLITCKYNLFKPFNNRFRSKQQFSQCKVQSTAKKFKELSASVGIRITFDEMQSSFARFNDRQGLAVELRLNVIVQLVQEIDLFEKQLGINCTREQIELFSNFHEWLPQPRVEIRKSPICSQVQLIPNCFQKKDRFPFNNTATVNTSFCLTCFRYTGLLK